MIDLYNRNILILVNIYMIECVCVRVYLNVFANACLHARLLACLLGSLLACSYIIVCRTNE